MSQPDPWQEAADCERAAQQQTEPVYETVYTCLRDLWVALASERAWLNENEFQTRVEIIGRAQDWMISKTATKH